MSRFLHNHLIRVCALSVLFACVMNLQEVYGQITVTGKVIDESSLGLISTNVVIKGTTIGTTTDSDGNYSIEVDDTASVLVFSYLGYVTQEIKVGGQTTINVLLKTDMETLEQVVVVGYGTQRKKDITGAIAVADMDLIGVSESNNVTNMLQGTVPGVVVVQDGLPGSIGNIRIRGNVFTGIDNGASANNPLFVIDGVLTEDSRFLNPRDIESIQVLKDASSAAIYGSRSANGVVIITTKKGKSSKPSFEFSSSFGIQQIPNQIELATTSGWARINRAIYNQLGQAPDLYADTSANGLYDPNRYTDWQKEMTGNANVRDINFNVSGGTKDIKVFFGLNNYRQEGVVGEPLFERYNLRLNTELKIGKKLTIGENLTIGTTNLSRTNESATSLESVYAMLPVVPVYDANNESGYGYGDDVRARTYASNPRAIQDLINNGTRGYHMLGNIFLKWQIFEDLEYKFNASLDVDIEHRKEYFPKAQIGWQEVLQSGLTEEDNQYVSYFIEHKLQYDKTFGKHAFSAMASYVGQQEQGRIHGTTINGGYENDGQNFWEIDASTAPLNNISSSGSEFTHAIESYLGRLTYDFDGKYLFNFMLRYDGSSRFASDYRWGTFPAASAGWIVSNENFFSSVPKIDFFKLRVGYGIVGNETGVDYIYQSELILRAIGGVNYNLGPGGQNVIGATRGKLANPYIQWEKLRELNIGTDLHLFDSRLELVFDYFMGETYDLIYQRPIPPSVGAEETSIIENNAGIERHGWEFSTIFKNRIGDFAYSIGGNISYVKSKLKTLGNDEFINDSNEADFIHARTYVGGTVGELFLLDFAGLYTQEDILALEEGFTVFTQVPVEGDAKYIDHGSDPDGEFKGEPDGIINEFDRISYGTIYPMFYGFNFSGMYKGFDLTIFFQGATRYDVFNSWYEYLNTDDFSNYAADYDPFIDGSGSDPRPVFGYSHPNEKPSTRYVENGAFFRLKNLQIGYTIPVKRLDNLRVYLSGQNLITFTNYKGLDPEIETTMFGPTVDQRGFPNLRIYSIGLSLKF